jgi:thioredoxin reductase
MATVNFDILIIGAGPGGIQLALTLEEIKRRNKARFTYQIIERDSGPGSFFNVFPVHGRLISNNKLYTGRDPLSRFSERFDWNSLITEKREILTRHYSRDFYPRREVIPKMLTDLCDHYQLPMSYNVTFTGIERAADGQFHITTDKESIHARYVVVATGLRPFIPDIPGIELTTPYASMRPKEHYRDKRTLIIGKGNSGLECAKEIINEASLIMVASPSPTRLAYRTHYVGSVRQTNALLIENYQLKHQAAILDCDIQSIARINEVYEVTVAYKHADGEVETLAFDEVIAATGFIGSLEVLMKTFEIGRLHDKFPNIDGMFQSCDVKGLYFAGALTHGPDYRGYSSSGFIHGFRYNAMILAAHLCEKLGITDERRCISPSDLVEHLFEELEEDAGIYLQPGFIGRCYQRSDDGDWVDLGHRSRRWFEDEAVEKGEILLLATLEYGDINSYTNPLTIPRHPGGSDESAHIHPVVRWRSSEGAGQVSLEEHLFNRFRGIPLNRVRLMRLIVELNAVGPALSYAT